MMPTENYKKFSNDDEIATKFYEVDQEARLHSSGIVKFISWNTMGSTAAGYAQLRKRTFSLISTHSPTDIWLLQEPFSYVRARLLREMGLRALDERLYNFAVENTMVSRTHACIVYNERKIRCLENATAVLERVRRIISQENMEYTLAARLCVALFQTIDDETKTITPTRFIAVSYHAVKLESDVNKLRQIGQFHILCKQLSIDLETSIIIGSDYNIDIRIVDEGPPPFIHIFNYAACRTRTNIVIIHNDDDERIDAIKIDYFAIISQHLRLPRECTALPVLILQNPIHHPYTGLEYATDTEARNLFMDYPHLPNLQLVSNHDPLYLAIELGD